MIGIRQLAALRAVADHGSVAKAALSLSWSQPTVNHHLRGLERELGAPVVAPSPGGTALTPVGAEMLSHARAVLDRVQRAQDEVGRFALDHQHRLRLGVFPTVAARLLPRLLMQLRVRGFTVVVREAEVDVLRDELADLRVDAALLYTTPSERRPTPTGFEARSLFVEPLDILLPRHHRLAAADRVQLIQFADEDWVLGAQRDEPLEQLLTAAAQRAGFTPRAAARSDDYRVVAAYVAAGVGVALVPRSAVSPSDETLVSVPLRDAGLHRQVQLLTSRTLAPPILEALIAAFVDARARPDRASEVMTT